MKHISLMILVALLFCGASTASATTVIEMDLEALTTESDAIVIGTIASVEAKVENGKVYTHVLVNVEETLKGDEQKTLRIVHIGGRTKELATVVHGMPGFRPEERALLFLEKPSTVDHYVVTGLSQGKIELEEDADGTWFVRRKTKNPAMVAPLRLPTGDVQLKRATAEDVQLERQALEELLEKIKAALPQPESTE